jgi:hypothetical protein
MLLYPVELCYSFGGKSAVDNNCPISSILCIVSSEASISSANILAIRLLPRSARVKEEQDAHKMWPAKATTKGGLVCARWTNSLECG